MIDNGSWTGENQGESIDPNDAGSKRVRLTPIDEWLHPSFSAVAITSVRVLGTLLSCLEVHVQGLITSQSPHPVRVHVRNALRLDRLARFGQYHVPSQFFSLPWSPNSASSRATLSAIGDWVTSGRSTSLAPLGDPSGGTPEKW